MFQGAFYEGLKIASSTTKSERNRNLRKNALDHYDEVCMACNFIPIVLRQLEVHHLYPLADRGPGYRILDDVAFLCTNCHWLAHDENPPIPLERLKIIIKLTKSPGISME